MTENNVTVGVPYVVIDVETTGIDASMHDLLEIAAVVIDPVTLEPVADIFEAVVKLDVRAAWNKATPFVREMHAKSGLWDRMETIQAMPLRAIDNALTNYLQLFGAPRSMPVMGNSVRLDMNFIDVNLPYVSGYLDFHMRDVSTIAGLASDWYGLPWFEKKKTHRAKDDVLECIAELKYLRDQVFREPVSVALEALRVEDLGWVTIPPVSETDEQYNRRRAEARRKVVGTDGKYDGVTPAQAFNAAFDLLSGRAPKP